MLDKHLLLTPDKKHRKIFAKTAIISFQRLESLKDIILRAKAHPIKKSKSFCEPCKKTRCGICEYMLLLYERV